MWKWLLAGGAVFVVLLVIGGLCALELLPLWVGVTVAVVVVLACAGVVAWRIRREARSGAELEDALTAYASRHAQAARPDRAAERAALDAEFRKAIAALKGSNLSRSRGNVLYTLPWYVILGPPGTGKTAALRNSGLKFPYLADSRSGALRGLGGTQNCDWWFTNDAILLDTAGRWATHVHDRDEWLAFLELLVKHRPRGPLNGILVAVSVSDLATAGPEGVAELAGQLRARLDEALGVLAIAVPVYLIVTKCDLLPGFVETFGDLPREARSRPWGFTLPFGLSHTELVPAVQARLEEQHAALERRALRRMAEERALRTRERIFSFPDQFLALAPAVHALVAHLFQENYYGETPRLRGVYCTSGTQEGRPFDLVMRTMAQGLGVEAQSALPPPPAEKKSYFLEGVFRGILFPDAVLASRSAQRRTSDRRIAGIAAAAVAAASLGALGAWTYGYLDGRARLGEVASAVDAAESALARSGASSPVEAAALVALGEQVHRLDTRAHVGDSWSFGTGTDDEALRVHLGRYYARLVRDGVVHRLHQQDLARLTALVERYEAAPSTATSTDDYRALSDGLFLHLLLTAPRSPGEPPFDPAMTRALVERLASSWSSALGAGAASVADTVAPTMAFVERLAHDPGIALPRRPELVERVRRVLARRDPAEAAVDALASRLATAGTPVDVRSIVGREVTFLRSSHVVPPAFTRAVYEARIAPLFADVAHDPVASAWVLGDTQTMAHAAPAARRARVLDAYFRRYVAEWRAFVDGLEVVPASSLGESFTALEALTRGHPSMLAAIFEAIAQNTALGAPSTGSVLTGAVAAAAARGGAPVLAAQLGAEDAREGAPLLGPADVRAAFDPLLRFAQGTSGEAGAPQGDAVSPLARYDEQLLYLRNSVRAVLEQRGTDAALRDDVDRASATLASLLEDRPAAVRAALRDVLWPPIDGAFGEAAEANARAVARVYCETIPAAFRGEAEGRYPFVSTGAPVELSALADLFHPTTGRIARFHAEERDAIAASEVRPSDGERSPSALLSPSLLTFVAQADAITALLFSEGAATAHVPLEVRLVGPPTVARVRLSVGGAQPIEAGGFLPVEWPGADPGAGAVLEVESTSGVREREEIAGVFGLFQLLERGRFEALPGGAVAVRLRVGRERHELTIEVRRAGGRTFPVSGSSGAVLPLVAPFRAMGGAPPLEPHLGQPACDTEVVSWPM